jgi:RNA:NAD 2'-phosphotransferase (TPT1/KptA family)
MNDPGPESRSSSAHLPSDAKRRIITGSPAEGWADIEELLRLADQRGKRLTRSVLAEVVESNDKKRFAISEDGLRIRAQQGHSIAVDRRAGSVEPPLVSALSRGHARETPLF